MNQPLDRCANLQSQVNSLLDLLHQPSLYPQQDTTAIEASLRKAISPKFEIVFAGAFSAGKSMLINASVLYSPKLPRQRYKKTLFLYIFSITSFTNHLNYTYR